MQLDSECEQLLFTDPLHLVRGFTTAVLGASILGLCQKIEIRSLRYLARGWAILGVEVLIANDFASLESILKIVLVLILSGVCLPMNVASYWWRVFCLLIVVV